MTWLLSLLVSILLPKLLEWLIDLFTKSKQLTGKELDKMNNVLWYCQEICTIAPKIGCKAVPLVTGGIGDWIINLLIEYAKKHGPELAREIGQNVILPWAKKKAAETQNKWDDYGAKQLERILNDPEFIALLEDIG